MAMLMPLPTHLQGWLDACTCEFLYSTFLCFVVAGSAICELLDISMEQRKQLLCPCLVIPKMPKDILVQLVPGAEYNSGAHLQLRRVGCGEVLAVQGLCILKHEAYVPTFKLTKLQSCGKLRKRRRPFGILSGTNSTALRLAQWCWLLHMLPDQFLGDSSILPSPWVLTWLVPVFTPDVSRMAERDQAKQEAETKVLDLETP